MRKFVSMLVSVLATGLFAATSSATLIDPSTWGSCVGASTCAIGNAALSASPDRRVFTEKSVADQLGMGISGGRTNGEIDMDEAFNVSYGVSEVISSIQFVFIYNGPEFWDVAEVAQVTVNGTSIFTLSVNSLSDNLAAWTGGSASNCGATTSTGSGCFNVTNPFGDLAVTSLSFTALAGGAPLSGPGTNQSDFSIGSISGASVPEPGTLTLLDAGLLGLGLMRRRQS